MKRRDKRVAKQKLCCPKDFMTINRNLIIFILLGIIAIVGVSIWQQDVQAELARLISRAALEWKLEPRTTTTESLLAGTTLVIIDDGEVEKRLELQLKGKATAFALLKLVAQNLGLALKTKEYDLGVFIEAVGSKKNGEDGKYWLYYVNGEMPQVAADKKEINPGDKVEFKFEKSPF